MNRLRFRRLRDEEVDQAYSIIVEAGSMLAMKGIRQWPIPLSRQIYQERQRRAEHFAFTCDGKLAVVISIIKDSPPWWIDETGMDSSWWFSTIVTSPAYRGRKLGRKAVHEAKKYLRDRGARHVYIDCVEGDFLPNYYRALGFRLIARKNIEYPTGVFKMALMKCALVDQGGD